jgi:hypothetical protein
MKRASRLLVAPHLVFGLAIAIYACTNTVPGAGLELVIDSNLTSAQFDSVSLSIQQQEASGAWGAAAVNGPFLVPGEATLPASFAIAAGTSSDQEILITLVALKSNQPVVTREVQLLVPTNRVAELTLLLVQACLDQTCTMPNESCQPDTGLCAPNTTVPLMLPTFQAEAGLSFYIDGGGKHDGGSGAGSGSGSLSGSGSGSGSVTGSGSGSVEGSGSGSSSGSASGSHDAGGHMHDSGVDGGQGSGVDSGHDSGVDGGHDGGVDSGPDSGCAPGFHCMGGTCVSGTISVPQSFCSHGRP